MIPLLPASIAIPRISLRTAIEIGAAAVLLSALGVQTVRIEGFKTWPVHIAGLKTQLADARTQIADTERAFVQTVADYRTAAEQARAADAANKARVEAEQAKINQEAVHDFETRIAAARAAAERLRDQLATATHSGGRPATPVPGVPASGGASEAPGENGFSIADRLLATEQAIQLDELIKAARKVMAIDPNGAARQDKAAGAKP